MCFHPFILFLSLLPFLGFCPSNYAEETVKVVHEGFAEGITVDLKEPLYIDGVMTTNQGGVISAPRLRIQAKVIRYTKKMIDKTPILTIEAEDQLMIEFGDYLFTGQKLYYDFQKKEGFIEYGRTAIEPWFFGGEKIEMRCDGSYVLYNGYITTSENEQPEWGLYSNNVYVKQGRHLKAYDVQLKLKKYTILWIPSLSANLDSIFDSPIRYRFRWGGRQGPRVGLTYEIFSWNRWKTFVRFDYRLARGPGGGIETRYHSVDRKTEFQSINYLARDSSLLDPNEKARYRFEGLFKTLLDQDKVSILMTYDKISDRDMPSSYHDRDFDFDPSERTQVLIRRQEDLWIGNLYTRLRINSFQTVKQELPTLSVNFKPFPLQRTGIIFENWASVSYLDFKYSKHIVDVPNYASNRFEYRPTLYRPFIAGPVTITPQMGFIEIFYGNSPKHTSQLLSLGLVGCRVETQLYKHLGDFKHVIIPYSFFHYYTSPTSSPNQHYIFDITDGWARLNKLTIGFKNSLLLKEQNGISQLFYANIYTHAFFNSKTIARTFPKLYGKFVFSSISTIKHTIQTAWDFQHHLFDHFNFRSEWTLSADFALAIEYRHRSAYSWRKVDEENFFLDSFRSENNLFNSALSDRRNTFLIHFFYRFHPNWACEFSSRQGWNRKKEPSYLEYEIDLLTTIQTAWHLRLSFQHRENDNRIALYVNVGLRRPEGKHCEHKIYTFD
ncbi:hypothetical protein [Candidatus Protochlamydia sp. W-9]|uniref:hypothetical protein n=1 Tax=Candidatus Protochlamydia sp. W-9 TaxID=1785087 RepID=UPI00096A6377|nr:hypothetical protein [Candidatus Protochlamydia sp. W-9]